MAGSMGGRVLARKQGGEGWVDGRGIIRSVAAATSEGMPRLALPNGRWAKYVEEANSSCLTVLHSFLARDAILI